MAASGPDGVLVVDKPGGCTSHDVVARGRRVFRTRAVGHTGTLDPMATGVLVLAIGEATKLVRALTADDKEYEAELRLGVATHSLDADGDEVGRAPVPSLDLEAAQEAARPFVGEIEQRAPAVSAIKVDGRALHERVRRGEDVEPPVRRVVCHGLTVTEVEGDRVRFVVRSGKGFYVRSLARDLAEALGTVGHLSALRRTRVGPFAVADAVPGDDLFSRDDAVHEAVRARLLPLAEAARGLPRVELTAEGTEDARHGRRIAAPRFHPEALPPATPERPLALFDPSGALVGLGVEEDGRVRIVRGIRAGEGG